MRKTALLTIPLFVLGLILVLNHLGYLPPFSSTYRSISNGQIALANPRIELITGNLEVPWAMAQATNGRIFLTERPGRVRVIDNGTLITEPMLELTDVAANGEAGLMGLALHPQFYQNRFVYLCYAYNNQSRVDIKVVMYQENLNKLDYPQVIIDQIPSANFHAGCELAFGPDGKLYITTGDAANKELAQNLSSLAGKILRLEADGRIPVDNPFVERPGARAEIWSFGHRNPQGIDWSTDNGTLYAAEHGPSGFDGPGGFDEVNIITRGGNFGWPLVIGSDYAPDTIPPIAVFTPAIAPASVAFYSGRMFPELGGHLLVAALRGNTILALDLDTADQSASPGQPITQGTPLIDNSYGRIRDIMVAQDGSIYFTTSNRDGRGNPAANDDAIYRISR